MKVGIIGIGNAGKVAMQSIFESEGAELVALCGRTPEKMEFLKEELGEIGKNIQYFTNVDDFFESRIFDSVIITTDHYSHPELAEKALRAGYNTLVEKPLGVKTDSLKGLMEAAEKTDKNFGIIYNQRLNPIYKKTKELITSDEIGEIKRSNWIMTTNYRTQAYYDSASWRGTWKGEGGGILLNQCSHNLDIWQWICGMPVKIQGFCQFGKERKVETETEATIYTEYANGATGTFVASVLEFPGTDRFEIVGEKGKIVLEDSKITLWKLDTELKKFNEELKATGGINYINSFKPGVTKYEIEIEKFQGSLHVEITKEWIRSVILGKEFIAPGIEGINALKIIEESYKTSFKDRDCSLY